MKRVLVLVLALTLVGGGIALAISDTGSEPAVVQTHAEGATTTMSLAQAVATAAEAPILDATPIESPAPEATEEPESEPPDTPTTFAEDSSSTAAPVVVEPLATAETAQAAQGDQLAQNALIALKQLLASPQAHDIDALTGAVKALDSAIAQIDALGLPVEQQQSEVAALLLARAHLIELITQVAAQNTSHPKATPTPRGSSSNRGGFFLGGSRDVPDVVSGLQVAPSQPSAARCRKSSALSLCH